jgi:mannan endo-1,4-beta-mannosidase
MIKYIIPVLILFTIYSCAQTTDYKPVTSNYSKEAADLLNYIYSISGKKTLTGQHDQPLFGNAYYQRVYEITGSHPALHGFDFGFSQPNTLDGINFRQREVDDAISMYKDGTTITFMWHAVPPNMDEPVTFREGIQSKLTDDQWNELITPGTILNLRWQSQVDVIAFFLKQLRDAKVPILWRPYHEMNGDWFWWGNRSGEYGYKKLYIMLYNRLVNYHKINNLIWVFNGNEINDLTGTYEEFFPGHEYVDILATDVYRKNYQQKDYSMLLKLADGKPIALGEVGKMPTPELLIEQPRWTWFMTWVDRVIHDNTPEELKALYNAENTLTREETISDKKQVASSTKIQPY